uniref:Putative secreted protein n=1 Tax=Anopheles marajoara TaxID=58244 RepID=A0A2M4C5Q7_9DIPT
MVGVLAAFLAAVSRFFRAPAGCFRPEAAVGDEEGSVDGSSFGSWFISSPTAHSVAVRCCLALGSPLRTFFAELLVPPPVSFGCELTSDRRLSTDTDRRSFLSCVSPASFFSLRLDAVAPPVGSDLRLRPERVVLPKSNSTGDRLSMSLDGTVRDSGSSSSELDSFAAFVGFRSADNRVVRLPPSASSPLPPFFAPLGLSSVTDSSFFTDFLPFPSSNAG